MKEYTCLWCHEIRCAAEGVGCVTLPHLAFAECIVNELDVPIERDQDVIEF